MTPPENSSQMTFYKILYDCSEGIEHSSYATNDQYRTKCFTRARKRMDLAITYGAYGYDRHI